MHGANWMVVAALAIPGISLPANAAGPIARATWFNRDRCKAAIKPR